jgi:hypothetical protein
MTKTIIVQDSATSKGTSREIINLIAKVKSKVGKVGSEGVLKDNIFYRIIKGGFMIF